MNYRIVTSAAAFASLGLLSGCTNVSNLDCEEIAEEARRISQEQPLKITEIRNSRETSRNEREARCTAQATFSDNQQRELELKAFYEGDNTMVSYTERAAESTNSTQPSPETEGGSEDGSAPEGETGGSEGGESNQ